MRNWYALLAFNGSSSLQIPLPLVTATDKERFNTMAIVARLKWINQFYQAHDNFPVDQYYEFTEQHQVFFGKRPILFAALTSLAVFSKRDPLQPLRLLL